ncbi:MAG TPA: DNA topoisomerase (ATP-hydrolyzing), partial [Dehalococcoidia bacterium]|nr:DNA topoisomerase (ATP-hydrolyzing) [Dehalococcoidia bacterium]
MVTAPPTPPAGRINPVRIEEEMRTSYLSYAMSVIVSRALPDVRDGLKPVQRRILYAMHEMGIRPNTAYRKCARIVGEVLGKYHPHGDASVYDALVRMAQPFSMRYPLIDGQGNYGSVDGDPPAAMRYTEARLPAIAEELLADIDQNTVDFDANFDDSMQEPTVLPSRLPNMLVNGASGIAVGMATNIPPHSLSEICDAICYVIDHPNCTVDDLIKLVPGPDFPTHGIIRGTSGIVDAYTTGRGRIVMEAATEVEELRGGRQRIIVNELPYQVNKASLVEKIAQLVRDKRIDGVSDIRDESDRHGMRIVIELRRDAQPSIVLNNLYRHTAMRSSFNAIMLALVDGQPQVLPLKRTLSLFIEHRQEVIRRRSEFQLQKAKERDHIVQGLLLALDRMDEVIAIIRGSRDVEAARNNLMERLQLTQVQAQAILDMQLRRLAALERERLEQEHQDLLKTIASLEELLGSPAKILAA